MARAAVANPMDKDDIDWQAMELRSACQSGDLEAAQELLEDSVNPRYCPPGACWTILSLAAHQGHSDVVGFFAGRRGAPKIEDVDAHGYQAIMWAAHSGDAESLRILIEKGADVNCSSETGATPLMMAAAEGHRDSVRLLLDAEADLNAVDKNGWRAVQKAAWWGHQGALAELLLEQTPSRELMRNLFTACKLQGHVHCKHVLDGTSGPRAYAHAKCTLTLQTSQGHKDATKELRSALSSTLVKHGVQPDDIAVPSLVEMDKNEAGKPVKAAEVEIRVGCSSCVGIVNDLRDALTDPGTPIRKNAKLSVDPASSKVEIVWPLERLAKSISEKYQDECPALKGVATEDLVDVMKAIEESIALYRAVMDVVKEEQSESLIKLHSYSSKARYFVEKDIPPPEETEDGVAADAPEPEPEFESLLMPLEEGRAKKYWEDWCEHSQSTVHAKRHAILQAIFNKSEADKAEKAEDGKKKPVEGEELLVKKQLTIQLLRKKGMLALTKLKTILAPGTTWAGTVMNDFEKHPLDSEERQVSPDSGPLRGGTASDLGLKSTELIEEKARVYAGMWPNFPGMDQPQYSMVTDLCSITVSYPTIDLLLQGLKELSSNADICWVNNGFRSPSILGCSEVSVGIRLQMPGGDSFIGEVVFTVRQLYDAKMDRGRQAFDEIRNALAGLGELPTKTQESLLRFIIRSLEETEGEGRRMSARFNPAPQPKKQQHQAKKPGASAAKK